MNSAGVLFFVVVLFVSSTVGVAAGTGGAEFSVSETQVADSERGSTTAEGIAGDTAATHVAECAATPPDDHASPEGGTNQTIGYVGGYWYDEPLKEIEGPSLDEDELDSFVNRTAARVEALRCLAFEEVPPVDLLTREEYRSTIEPQFDTIAHEEWQFEDARLAAMLVAGQEASAKDLQIESQTAFPAAFYNTEDEFMGFITDDPDTIEINQVTLAHELTHALQDQHFGIEVIFDEPTNDQFIAALSIAEGDATAVDELYEQNCEQDAWPDECIIPVPSEPDVPSWGLVLNQLAAYHTPLVAETAESEGSSGVDELFEEYPDSMVESIYPDMYGEFERESVLVEDGSTDEWERIRIEDADGDVEEAYDIIGQHGLTALLAAPTFETEGLTNIIDPTEFQQQHDGGFLTYSVTETSGWQADRLYGYTNDAGDNASVWKLAWEDSEDAETFADAYEQLIDFREGELEPGYENVFTFEASDEYDMAVALNCDDDRLWVVTAPTVDDLTAVHQAIELVEADDPTPTPTPEATPETTPVGDDTGTDDAVDDDGAGFGLPVAVLAVLGTGVFALRRRG